MDLDDYKVDIAKDYIRKMTKEQLAEFMKSLSMMYGGDREKLTSQKGQIAK